jgi:hypothetical protein
MLKHTVNKVSSLRDFVVVVARLGTALSRKLKKCCGALCAVPAFMPLIAPFQGLSVWRGRFVGRCPTLLIKGIQPFAAIDSKLKN